MDDIKHIIKLLEEQGKQISKIEQIISSQQNGDRIRPGNIKHVMKKHEERTNKQMTDAKKLQFKINNLYKNNFFQIEKKLGDVYKELDKDGFHFKKGSIQYALDSAEYLDRIGQQRNYRWIQKYPPD